MNRSIISEIKSLEAKLRYLKAELDSIYEIKTLLNSSFREGNGSGESASPVERYIMKIEEYYEEIGMLSEQLTEKRKKLWIIVSSFPDSRMIDIVSLRLRGTNNLSEIGQKLSTSERTVRRVLDKAFQMLNDRYNDSEFMKFVDIAYEKDVSLNEVLPEKFLKVF